MAVSATIKPLPGMVECPNCNPCSPELDEDGRPYTCYYCGDTGWVPDESLAERPLFRFRVHMHSRSGMWESYDGHVDVGACDEDDATERALTELRRTSFPDRPRDAWVVDSVTQLAA